MSVPTAELAAPAAPRSEPAVPSPPPRRLSGGRLYLAFGAFALLVAVLSLLIPSTPSYDPWAWLVWGREIAHLDLHTTGGPSWKPLTVIFTTVFALFGKAAPDMWLVVARAGAVMAVLMTFKVAWRVARGLFGEPWPRGRAGAIATLPVLLAAAVAAASLVNSPAFVSDNALGYSEGLMTALVLIALDRHLDGARRQAFAVGFFAALDRPELWLLWGPYGLYLWWRDPGARKLVAGLFVMVPLLWFLPELWGSGHLFRGVTRAHHPRSNSAAFAHCPFCTELVHHAWPRVMFRVKAVGLLAMAVGAVGLWPARHALLRRRPLPPAAAARLLLVLVGVIGWLWWIGVSVETQAGFSGNDRYLVLGTALISIAGGVGWGWAAAALARLVKRLGLRGRVPTRATASLAAASGAGTLLAALVLIATPPWIGPSILDVPATHRSLAYQAKLRTDLGRAIRQLGGPKRILRCGTVMAEGFQVPMIAYQLGVRTTRVQAPPNPIAPAPWPKLIFQARDTRHAALLPVPAQIIAWERDGAHYTYRHVRTFRVFSDCANRA